MTNTTKVLTGTGILGGGSVATYGILELGDFLDVGPVKLLSETEAYKSETTDKVGKVFRRFLISADAPENSAWWRRVEKYVMRYDNTDGFPIKNDFEGVKKSGSEYKPLNEICKALYEKNTSEIGNSGDKWKEMWYFCSVFRMAPTQFTTTSENYTQGKWGWSGNGNGNKNHLLSDVWQVNTHPHIIYFWNVMYEKILVKELNETGRTWDDKFKNVKSGKELRDECNKAYKSNETETSSTYGENAKDYCAVDKRSISKYPTSS